jgi:hypothetical protein
MDPANWLSALVQAGHLFVQSIPEAFWLAYYWAREWQALLGGLLLVLAARIFALGAIRAARIRSAATIRAAQIEAGVAPHRDEVTDAPRSASPTPPDRAIPREHDLVQKIEQLRSLIRSAMFTLTTDEQGTEAGPNPYCARIVQLRFDEKDLPANPTAGTLELYKKLLMQLAAVRRANERKPTQAELSETLVQLNARAREFAAALTRVVPPASPAPERQSNQLRA